MLPGGAADDKTLVPIPQEARDRAKACLAALDQWEAAEKVRHAQVDHWEAKMDRLNDLQYKVAEAIVELPALTMQGVNAKLSIVSANPYYAEDRGITASVAHDARRIDGNALLSPPVAA